MSKWDSSKLTPNQWIIGKKWYAFKTINRRFSATFHKHLV